MTDTLLETEHVIIEKGPEDGHVVLHIVTDGVISEFDAEAYLRAVAAAYEVHIDRERSRHGLWKQYSAKDQVRQIKIKSERVLHALDREEHGISIEGQEHDMMMAEYPDLINYAIFGWRIEKEMA